MEALKQDIQAHTVMYMDLAHGDHTTSVVLHDVNPCSISDVW